MLNQAPENVGTSTNDNLRPTMKFLKSLMVRCPVDAGQDVQVVLSIYDPVFVKFWVSASLNSQEKFNLLRVFPTEVGISP
jgi:hypothetical protein